MSKAIDYIEEESFVIGNPEYPVISKEDAIVAVRLAETEMKERAIKAACLRCVSHGNCGHIDMEERYFLECDELMYYRLVININTQ